MPARLRSMGRDVGTALAVLTVYLLVLLTPLHQAAATQFQLAELGYAPTIGFDICGEPAEDGQPATAKCPISGVAKFDFAGLEPVIVDLDLPRTADAVVYAFDALPSPAAVTESARQARGPPALV